MTWLLHTHQQPRDREDEDNMVDNPVFKKNEARLTNFIRITFTA